MDLQIGHQTGRANLGLVLILFYYLPNQLYYGLRNLIFSLLMTNFFTFSISNLESTLIFLNLLYLSNILGFVILFIRLQWKKLVLLFSSFSSALEVMLLLVCVSYGRRIYIFYIVYCF